MAYIGRNPRLKSIVSQGDTLANLTAEPRVAGRLVYATDEGKFYTDNGTILKAVEAGGGGADPENEEYLYMGDRNTDGSWRFIVVSGALNIEVRVAGVWVVKDTINP